VSRQVGHVLRAVDYFALIRRQIADGRWRIGRRQTLRGQRVVELIWVRQPGLRACEVPRYIPGCMIAHLWVSARSHLPVRLDVFTALYGKDSHSRLVTMIYRQEQDYQFLPPTSANLAQLQVPVPAGFTQCQSGQTCPRHHAPARSRRAG